MNRSLIFFSTIECWWAWLDLKNGLGTKKQPNILFLITMKHNLIFFSDFNFLILSHSVLIPTFINYIYQMVRQPIYISHMPLVSFSPSATAHLLLMALLIRRHKYCVLCGAIMLFLVFYSFGVDMSRQL